MALMAPMALMALVAALGSLASPLLNMAFGSKATKECENHESISAPNLDDVLAAESWARDEAGRLAADVV